MKILDSFTETILYNKLRMSQTVSNKAISIVPIRVITISLVKPHFNVTATKSPGYAQPYVIGCVRGRVWRGHKFVV